MDGCGAAAFDGPRRLGEEAVTVSENLNKSVRGDTLLNYFPYFVYGKKMPLRV